MIEDIATAKLQLRNISYFRIASYLRYMEGPNVDLHAMGFPQGWENEPLWRL